MKSLSIREQCLPPDDPEIGNSYSNYGHALIDCGKYLEAQYYYRQAIYVHERAETPSSDLLEEACSCMGKSMLYFKQFEDAEINMASAYHAALGPDNFFVAETLFALCSLRMRQNRWSSAEELLLRNYTIRRNILGPNARLVGVCLFSLAFTRAHGKRIPEAMDNLEQSA